MSLTSCPIVFVLLDFGRDDDERAIAMSNIEVRNRGHPLKFQFEFNGATHNKRVDFVPLPRYNHMNLASIILANS